MLANAGGVPGTNSVPGPPTGGTFTAGEQVIDSLGAPWECVAGGTPGTWAQIGDGQGTSLP